MDQYGVYARFYDLDLGEQDEDLFLIEQFAARCGSPILEMACGTGRVLIPLARQGYEVTGVDVSPAMLEVARRRIAAEGLTEHVNLVQQDMRELVLDRRFNLVFVAVNSFMHLLTLEDQLRTLVRIRQHLNPNGLLLLDLFNPDLSRLLSFQGQVILDKVMIDPETGHRLLKFRSERVDLGRQIIDVTYLVDELDGEGRIRRTLFPFSIRYLFAGELELLLRSAEFHIEAIYGSYELDPFTGDSERMIAVARRPA
ncbi:MAG: SAM-dependent methyltransferase [Anaerolineae bacterium]